MLLGGGGFMADIFIFDISRSQYIIHIFYYPPAAKIKSFMFGPTWLLAPIIIQY